MDDLLAQFVIEAAELTQQAAEDLLALDLEPGNRARLESAFRAVHTLKGSVGLFDLLPMQRALHAAEDTLGRAIGHATEMDTASIDPVLAVLEWIDRCVRHLQGTGTLPPASADEGALLVRALSPAVAISTPSPSAAGPVPKWAKNLLAAYGSTPSSGDVALRYTPASDCFFNGDDPIALMAAVPGVVFAAVSVREEWPATQDLDPFRSNLVFEAISSAERADIEAIFRLIPDQIAIAVQLDEHAPKLPAVTSGEATVRTVRVDIARVDEIVGLVGELLTATNGMAGLIMQSKTLDGGLPLARHIRETQQDFGRLIGRLQRAAVNARMVPLNDTLRRLSRLTREISSQTGKPIDLTVSGGEIEADKSIVDGLYEPLLHIIRNAADHGIESEVQRQSAGKAPRGSITVAARQVGHRIELTIADDGEGIELQKIVAQARARGLLDESVGPLDEADILELLFIPGFSTSKTVTDLSGRGVGMDAVRAAVHRLGGRAHIASVPAIGTTITLSLPTSFTVSRAMVVRVGAERYGVPMDAIAETVKVSPAAISPIRSGEAFVLRNRTIPLIRLGDLVGQSAQRGSAELILVLNVGDSVVGLAVDAIGERFEALLRPPVGLMKAVRGILGTTVLGDGGVVMVLDLEALLA